MEGGKGGMELRKHSDEVYSCFPSQTGCYERVFITATYTDTETQEIEIYQHSKWSVYTFGNHYNASCVHYDDGHKTEEQDVELNTQVHNSVCLITSVCMYMTLGECTVRV